MNILNQNNTRQQLDELLPEKEIGDTKWIYVGADITKKCWSKIGKTKNGLSTRSSASQNPDYLIYGAFQIRAADKVDIIEIELIEEFTRHYERKLHVSSGKPSEVFICRPETMFDHAMAVIESEFGSHVYWESNEFHEYPVHYICSPEVREVLDRNDVNICMDNQHISRRFVTGNDVMYRRLRRPVDW